MMPEKPVVNRFQRIHLHIQMSLLRDYLQPVEVAGHQERGLIINQYHRKSPMLYMILTLIIDIYFQNYLKLGQLK